jgi:hypothetical protein
MAIWHQCDENADLWQERHICHIYMFYIDKIDRIEAEAR